MQNVTKEREGKPTALLLKNSDLVIIISDKTQLQTACLSLMLPGLVVTTCLLSPTVHSSQKAFKSYNKIISSDQIELSLRK